MLIDIKLWQKLEMPSHAELVYVENQYEKMKTSILTSRLSIEPYTECH